MFNTGFPCLQCHVFLCKTYITQRVVYLPDSARSDRGALSNRGLSTQSTHFVRSPHYSGLPAGQLRQFSSIQFRSVQDGIYALGKAYVRSAPSLRSFPNVAFETGFQCSSDRRWPPLVLSRKIVQRFLFPRLSPPGDRWCDGLGFLPAVNVSSFSTLRIFRKASRM